MFQWKWKVFSNHNDSMRLWFSLLIKCISVQETGSCEEKSSGMEEPSGVLNKNSWCDLSLWLSISPSSWWCWSHHGWQNAAWNSSFVKRKSGLKRIVAAGEALQDSPGPRGLNWRWNLPHLEPAALNPSQTPQENRGLFAFPAWVLFFQTANPLFEFPFPSPRTSSSQDLGFKLCSCQEKHFGLGSAWAQPSSALFALQLVPLRFNPKLTLHNAFCGRWGEEQAGD